MHFLRLPPPAVRIVFDVSPLALPRTGIGNCLRGALGGLAEAGGAEHEIVAFARHRPARQSRDPARARRRLGVRPRLVYALRRAHAGATRGAVRAGRPLERVLGRFDVLHYSDWWYPPQAGGVRATMIHDLVPLRFPEWTQAATRRLHGAKYRDAARTCDVVFVNSALHGATTSSSCSASTRRAGPRRATRASTPSSGRTGRAPSSAGPTSSRWRRSSRARTSRTLLAAHRLLADTGLALAVAVPRAGASSPSSTRPA